MRRLPLGVYPELCEILRGVCPEWRFFDRLRMTEGEGLAMTEMWRQVFRLVHNITMEKSKGPSLQLYTQFCYAVLSID
jgi:hypothetical protein